MSTQVELELENNFIQQLEGLGYERVLLRTEKALVDNLKLQIQKLNQIHHAFSEQEWKQVWHYLTKETSVFGKAQLLRDRFPLKFDDGTVKHLSFLGENATDNIYQVSNQIVSDHSALNGKTSRFDVTLLVNGFPLIQVELKRRGVEIQQAFKQTIEYAKSAYKAGDGLFGYIQFFVISNGVNCLYYANGTKNIEFAFPWADENNKNINDLTEFTNVFLNPKHAFKMLSQYIVLHHSDQFLMILRPYQIYAIERMVEHVKISKENAYIWHTTGSGKTLTSFKASQLLIKNPEIRRVIFVVDRKDLDEQTYTEFNAYREGSVDSTNNTANLIKQLRSLDNRLVLTTIQKLNNAITKDRHQKEMADLQKEKVIFIFDECHRSQFGETHQNIKRFFKNAQMFGFTGTPIFDENGLKKSGEKFTTEFLFPKRLHEYLIVDAITDRNVLPFQIDYWGKYSATGETDSNEKVEEIDSKELYDNPERLEKIVRHILSIHDKKTRNREFCAMFCVSSVENLIQYYELFEKVQAEMVEDAERNKTYFQPISVRTIFSFGVEEQDQQNTADEIEAGMIAEEPVDAPNIVDESRKAKLDKYIAQYNETYGSSYNTTDSFYEYYQNLGKRVKFFNIKYEKDEQIDLLLVVNMFLTGFDSKPLNTIYVDKNLKYHGLIQAFSRTNRVYKPSKPFGNVVCYRNLKQATDKALRLFSDKKPFSSVTIPEMSVFLEQYETAVAQLKTLTPNCQNVDDLKLEAEQLNFVETFREVLRLNNLLNMFTEYDKNKAPISPQDLEDYKGKYKDLYNRIKQPSEGKDKTSVLDDIDFQLELVHNDRVNQDYIMALLGLIVTASNQAQKDQRRKELIDMLSNDAKMYNKKDLIEKFINEQLPKMITGQTVKQAFSTFWDAERAQAYEGFCRDEQLKKPEFDKVADNFNFTERLPLPHEIKELPIQKPPLLKRNRYFAELHSKTSELLSRYSLKL
ncbi:type I restriction endonuclease subunit R [Acinetobacter baumannii]|nr:type I restriction endonuclease subunit R [Acinetobacter baumannii]